jgi:superfamily II DNA or RNA helicase/HKD family nuclease
LSRFPEAVLTVGGDNPFLPSLLEAINHADDIAIATAFIRMTGVRLIQAALGDALERGARVRILTGDYLGVTDPQALRYLMLLQEQGANVKVFESQNKTSFHMKAYLFTRSETLGHREGCAFIGSSNLSHAALVSGLEWNLKVDEAEDQGRFAHILSEYQTLYANPWCKALSHQWIDEYIKRVPDASSAPPATEPGQDEQEPPPEPNAIQKEALEALANSREQGYRRGLVVLATGLGKTWLSAFDSHQMNAKRVLFVAHREEILKQAEETFVRIRPDVKVGRYNGQEKQLNVDMLFASVQTLGKASHLNLFGREHFDYIIVDEFHHAAARTYRKLLNYFEPRFLLGLTATPERTDQSDILALCDDNLVYTKDLFHGIETKLLCPFAYYGIADEVNYQAITWRNGKFDPQQLENQLATNARARHNFRQWQDKHQSRTLAFCISKKHADFMADYFSRQGIRSAAVHSDSEMRRNEALSLLAEGKLQVIFSVDLFNEGIDLPAIDTVLMLRPTESKIIFLQQLGRGLRNSPGTLKEKLTVLDFIGNHVSFFKKPEALFNVGVTTKERKAFIDAAREESLDLPAGCFVNYDLQSIDFMEQLVATKGDMQLEIYRNLKASLDRRPTLAEFYRVGGSVETLRKDYGQWYAFVKDEQDLTEIETECLSNYESFFGELETTSLTKSFKLVLLEALIELDGFSSPPTTHALAVRSFEVLQRRRILLGDLPDKYRDIPEISEDQVKGWHKYWSKHPINAWIGGNTTAAKAHFHVSDGNFIYKHLIPERLADSFSEMVQELVDFRFRQYESRLEQQTLVAAAPAPEKGSIEIPFFTDLKVACGHFRESPHDNTNIDYRPLPSIYADLDPARHFVAQASGNSMNGGDHPIKDGDYLLFQLLPADLLPNSLARNEIREPGASAPELAKLGTVVAENRQGSGHEFLVRNVEAGASGNFVLAAQNPSYPEIQLTREMALVAQLKTIIDPLQLQLHKSFMRADIPPLFGLEFNKAIWETGHVCPKEITGQILLVTLNKQGKNRNEQYHDYFIDEETFHWQSQNSAGPTGKKGKGIIEHRAQGSEVHLFVRKNKLQDGKAGPFSYCGMVDYQSHKSEKPMNVTWRLQAPLSEQLYSYFTG